MVPTRIRNVSQLKSYLKKHSLSPETFATQVKISNMTIRRMLKETGSAKISEKYHATFDAATAAHPAGEIAGENGAENFDFSGAENDFTELLADLEKQGTDCVNEQKIQSDAEQKTKDPLVGNSLKSKVFWLLNVVRDRNGGFKSKAIALGALLYFINPIDLIPDATPVVGYLDDYAVLSLSAALIIKQKRGERDALNTANDT